MKRALLLRRIRYALWTVALLAIGYLMLRFETLHLPEEGCSPLRAVPPGSRLWIDRWPESAREGDVVLFRDPAPAEDGEAALLLGRIEAAPTGLDPDAAARLADGGLWVVGDDPRCPSRDSRLFGPLPRGSVEGRLVFTW